MSYTSVELVRNHLNTSSPILTKVLNQPVVLDADEYVVFFSGGIDANSLVVKIIRGNDLSRKTVTLSGGEEIISAAPVVHGTVLVASDSSLGTVYVEGADYLIDYAAGLMTLNPGGGIIAGQQVTIWFQPYIVCSSGSDYVLDSRRAAIKRLSSGTIGEREAVYLDYAPVFISYQDELLNSATAEANAMVEKAVDPNRQFGADPVLQGAATYRALEIICRASALRELGGQTHNDKAALVWMKLSDMYAERSEKLLTSFRAPASGPSAPVKS